MEAILNKEKSMLNLLVRAAELIEEVFTRHPELIHDDHAQDYADIITALHASNVFYRANPKILQMAHYFNPLKSYEKMPMEKAKRIKIMDDKQQVG